MKKLSSSQVTEDHLQIKRLGDFELIFAVLYYNFFAIYYKSRLDQGFLRFFLEPSFNISLSK
jgi:hypothetical protein